MTGVTTDAGLFQQQEAEAAVVTLDDFSGAQQATAATPWTGVTHALGANANRIDVMVVTENDPGATTVTAGGVAMTAGVTSGSPSGSSRLLQSFYLDDTGSFPSPGNISIVVTPTNAVSGYTAVWSANDAQSGAPNRSDPAAVATSSTAETSLADVPGGSLVLGGGGSNNNTGLAVAGEDTEDFADGGAAGGHQAIFCHNLPPAQATITHSYSGGTSNVVALMLEILPA